MHLVNISKVGPYLYKYLSRPNGLGDFIIKEKTGSNPFRYHYLEALLRNLKNTLEFYLREKSKFLSRFNIVCRLDARIVMYL